MNHISFALVGAGLLLTAGLRSEEPAPPVPATPGQILKVMAWNIHHGQGGEGRLDLARIAGVIKQSAADIVLLQEVDDRTRRSGQVSQVEELAHLTGLKGVFGKAMDFQGGGYGNAVLVRWEPIDTRVIPLPGGGEPRCALEVTIEPPGLGARISVVSTHLDVSSAAVRATHARQLAEDFLARPHLVMVGGDFNATRSEDAITAFADPWVIPEKHGTNPGTFPATDPSREIDFILLKPASSQPAFLVLSSRVIEEKVASDHRPIFMELQISCPR